MNLTDETLLRKVLPEKQQNLDLATVGRYGVLGSTVFPTLMFYWYKLLDGRIVGTTPKIIVTKVLIDFVATMPLIIGPLHLSVLGRFSCLFNHVTQLKLTQKNLEWALALVTDALVKP